MVIKIKRLRSLLIIFLIFIGVIYLLQAKWFWKLSHPWPYQQEITEVAVNSGVDPFLLVAVIKVESSFDPQACSDAGAIGLMQVMPSTAKWVAGQIEFDNYQTEMLYQKEVNMMIGSWYLSNLLKEFDGNMVAALAAYNAGRGNVGKWMKTGQWKGTANDLNNIPFPETRSYIKSVLRNYEIYKYLYE